MRTSSTRTTLIIVAALAAALGLSLFLYFGNTRNRAERTLFFPEISGPAADSQVRLTGEKRRVPAHRTAEDNVRQLVQELVLGPARPEHVPLLGDGTHVLSVVYRRGGDAYIDLSRDILSSDDAVLRPEVQISALASNVYFNFPSVHRVYVLIEGQAPDFSMVTGDPRFDFRGGVNGISALLR